MQQMILLTAESTRRSELILFGRGGVTTTERYISHQAYQPSFTRLFNAEHKLVLSVMETPEEIYKKLYPSASLAPVP